MPSEVRTKRAPPRKDVDHLADPAAHDIDVRVEGAHPPEPDHAALRTRLGARVRAGRGTHVVVDRLRAVGPVDEIVLLVALAEPGRRIGRLDERRRRAGEEPGQDLEGHLRRHQDLAQKIAALMGREVSFESDPERTRPAESEVERLRGDNRRIRALTGWAPTWTLDAGLSATITWLRENGASYRGDRYAI